MFNTTGLFGILCNYVFTALFIIDQPLLLFNAPMKILFYQYVLIFNNEPMLFLSSANIFSKVHMPSTRQSLIQS